MRSSRILTVIYLSQQILVWTMAFDLRGSLTRLVVLLFLNGVSAVDAQLLDPVKNYCSRYDHQCKRDCSAD